MSAEGGGVDLPLGVYEVKPLRWVETLVHYNMGDQPHIWKNEVVPVYPDAPEWAKNLKSMRLNAELSVRIVAPAIGMSLSVWSGLEHGRLGTDDEATRTKMFAALTQALSDADE